MPYPNEHAARIESPSRFGAFRRVAWGRGISAIFGIPRERLRGGRASIRLQALRFDAKRWTVLQARRWLDAHGYVALVEEATRTREHASERENMRAWKSKIRAAIKRSKRARSKR